MPTELNLLFFVSLSEFGQRLINILLVRVGGGGSHLRFSALARPLQSVLQTDYFQTIRSVGVFAGKYIALDHKNTIVFLKKKK